MIGSMIPSSVGVGAGVGDGDGDGDGDGHSVLWYLSPCDSSRGTRQP